MSRMTSVALATLLVCSGAVVHAAKRPPINLAPAAPEQVLNHHLVRSARLGPPARPAGRVELMPWRTRDDVVEGWDWSLPPGIEPVADSGVIFSRREKRLFPGNRLGDVAVFWRDVEREEGRFDFESVRRKLESLPAGTVGVRFHFYATVSHRLSKGRRTTVAPEWLAKCGLPVIDMTSVEGRFQLFNYPIWDPRYHRRYLRVIEALGDSGIPRMKALRIVYVGAISKSWGEEMFIPRDVADWCEKHAGLSPQSLEKCLTERLDAWARAFRGAEHKLAWVGAGSGGVGKAEYRPVAARIMARAYRLGMGQRCGFVENYLYHLHNPHLGQRTDDDGYLHVDEACPPIAEGRAFGDENEEYGRYWTGRFGPLETHAYRYHESMLRLLQMRRNYVWMSSSSVDMDPALTAYVSLALGRRVGDSPDAFCYLRESTVRAGAAGKKGRTFPIRNFERWLIQRDREGCRTRPAVKAAQHEMMWMVPKGHKFDWIARRTDLAGGSGRIGLALDDRFLAGGPHRVAVKVTYHDIGRGRWSLVYARPGGGVGKRRVSCGGSGKVFTATFHLDDACFGAKGEAFDFHIEAEGADATVSFVRVVKKRPSRQASGVPRAPSTDPQLKKEMAMEAPRKRAATGAAAAPSSAAGTQLTGLKAERGWMTRMGGMVGCARHLKLDASPSWIYGGSGHAFALNIHELICPSGPTAWPTEHVNRLAANVGMACEWLTTPKDAPDAAAKLKETWQKGTAALDEGRCCMAWWLDHGEWYVINGYDANGSFLYDDFGRKTGRKHYTKLADNGTDFAAMLVLGRTKPADDAKTFTDAVRFALDHAAGRHSREIWYTGLVGYDAWIAALTSDEALKNKDIGFGHAYNAQCWAECRRHAVQFLQEANKRLGGARLDKAIGPYRTVSERLGLVAKTFPFNVADRKGMDERIHDAARRRKAVKALAEARAAELAGLKALAEVAVALGARGIEPKAVGATAVAVATPTAPGQVLLKEPVVAFNNLIGRIGSHGVMGGEDGTEEYIQPSVYVSLHVVQMRAAGWDVDFDTVAAVSGDAALFAYDPESMFPKYRHLMVDVDKRIADATGFGYEWVRFADAEGAWQLVKQSVDAGRSVKGEDWEGILFAGYQDAEAPAGRKVFAMADGPGTYAKWLTWKQFTEWVDRVSKWNKRKLGRHTRRVRKTAAKAAALGVIRELVDWSARPPAAVARRLPDAKLGLAGIAAYASDVADAKGKPASYFKEGSWRACHAINPQWIGRNCTAVYLQRIAAAKVFPKAASERLLAAAKAYRAAYLAWGRFYERLGHHAPEGAWDDAARRSAGAAAVREALRHERAALAELTAALKHLPK